MDQRMRMQSQHQPCPHCGENKKDQKQHEREHTGPTFQCNICNKIYLHQSSLSAHLRIHSNTFTCSICKTAYSRERELIKHNLRVHGSHTAPLFSCKSCDLMFKNTELLKCHIKQVHSAVDKEPQKREDGDLDERIRRHVCSICQTAFLKIHNLISHSATHLDNPPMSCKLCDARFQTYQSLTFHTNQVHRKVKLFRKKRKIKFKNEENLRGSSFTTENDQCQSKRSIYIRQSLSEDPHLWPKVLISRHLNDLLMFIK